jgi:PAS domain-containing protein
MLRARNDSLIPDFSQCVSPGIGQMRSDVFDRYYTEPSSPSETDLRLIEDAGHITEIAIDGERSQAAPTGAFDELAKSEAELRTTVDSIPQLMVVIGSDGNLLYANQALLEYSGLMKEEVGSERFREIFHPDDSKRLRGDLSRGPIRVRTAVAPQGWSVSLVPGPRQASIG